MIDRRPGRILIIDDEPAVLDVLQLALEEDYLLRSASSGMEGLRLAQAEPPDLILLDITMPGMDGLEVCRMLKADRETRSIPVIFITARDSPSDEASGLEAGAVDYISKPVNPLILRARVSTHFELKQSRDYLKGLATVDPLTELCNRRGLDEHFDREWRRAARRGAGLSVLLMDVDCLKAYNQSFGHLAGDVCLRRVAAELRSVPRRGGDLVARYEGGTFMAILANTGFDAALLMAGRMRESVEALAIRHPASSAGEFVTLSVGIVSVTPQPDDDRLIVVETVDQQLFVAKEAGRNALCGRNLDDASSIEPVVERSATAPVSEPLAS